MFLPATRRGFALVELLVVVVIIAILAVILLPRLLGGRDAAGKTITAPAQQAQGVACRSNLQQIRQAISMETMADETAKPADLAALRLPSEMLACPVSRQGYQYDPQAGAVRCPTHPDY